MKNEKTSSKKSWKTLKKQLQSFLLNLAPNVITSTNSNISENKKQSPSCIMALPYK
jgi:hypothetical protein